MARENPETNPIAIKDCKPHDRAVLLVSLTLLLSARIPLLNKIFCLVSMGVSLDNSFPSVRQKPTLRGLGKGPLPATLTLTDSTHDPECTLQPHGESPINM